MSIVYISDCIATTPIYEDLPDGACFSRTLARNSNNQCQTKNVRPTSTIQNGFRSSSSSGSASSSTSLNGASKNGQMKTMTSTNWRVQKTCSVDPDCLSGGTMARREKEVKRRAKVRTKHVSSMIPWAKPTGSPLAITFFT